MFIRTGQMMLASVGLCGVLLLACTLPGTDSKQALDSTGSIPPAAQTPSPGEEIAAPSGINAGWLSEVDAFLAADSRRILERSDGILVARTRQGFRGVFSPAGVRMLPQPSGQPTNDSDAWKWSYRLTSVGREGQHTATLRTVAPTYANQKVTYIYPEGVVETWENRKEGIEQRVTLPSRPSGHGRVVLAGPCKTNLASVGRKGVLTWKNDGLQMLSLSHLVVNDATGRELPSELELVNGHIRMSFDDNGARYPVIVDPILDNAAWTADATDTTYAKLGTSVASAGDVNGDGYSDVLIGAPVWSGAHFAQGRTYLYHGSSTGLSAANKPDWTANPHNLDLANFGCSVAGAGDIDNDGYDDVIIGACSHDFSADSITAAVYVYHGSSAGLPASDNYEWYHGVGGNQILSRSWVSAAGDVNGDGFGDVVVGVAPWGDAQHASSSGQVLVYHGSATGLASEASPDWVANPLDQNAAYFGDTVSGNSDINGDGYDDVIIGAPGYDGQKAGEGRVYVYFGSSAGLSAHTNPDWTADPTNEASAAFGSSVAGAGDVNGDGFDDLLIGAARESGSTATEGRAYIYYGSSGGPSAAGKPDWVAEPTDQMDSSFGYAVAMAGDVNGDGFSDVLIGAYRYSTSFFREGRTYLYYGSATGVTDSTTPDWQADSADQADADFGFSVASAGDINNDGYSDILVGARRWDGEAVGEGRTYLFMGAASVPCVPVGAEDITCDGIDDDCNGSIDDGYVPNPLCGVGVCTAGTTPSNCTAGTETPCSPGPQSEASDITCDALDGDCDGNIDEDYVADSTCGVGVCEAGTAPSSCSSGTVTPCSPGAQNETSDTTCDGLDGDCDGGIDEDYVVDSACGVGVCQSGNTPSACVSGVEAFCIVGPQDESSDITCDGVDGDCDGGVDEDYVADSTCGVGVCEAGTTPSSCSSGTVTPCSPGAQNETNDTTCDGLDGDCDGGVDEDYVVDSACGMGICQSGNTPSACVSGVEAFCTVGPQDESSDITCNGLDGDCDGNIDEDYVGDSTCGVGVCEAGTTPSSCSMGTMTPCSPGAQNETSDTTCDGLDGDCDGDVDEDYVIDSACGVGVCQSGNTPSACVSGIESYCSAGNETEIPEISCSDNQDNDCDGTSDIADSDCAGVCSDIDADSVCDVADNCVDVGNADQLDTDTDGEGDACDSDDDGDGWLDGDDPCPLIVTPVPFTQPIAFIGPDSEVAEKQLVILDGSGSCFAIGTSKAYTWLQTSGPQVSLANTNLAQLSFSAPTVNHDTLLSFELIVEDGAVQSLPVVVHVTVRNTINEVPVADAGADQIVYSGDAVTLESGNSYDPNGDTLSILWSKLSGPPVTLEFETSHTPSFTAPDLVAADALTFQVLVSDTFGASSAAEVTVTVLPSAGLPVFVSSASTTAMLNEAYEYDDNSIIEVAGALPIMFGVEGGPAGFAISESGEVTWIPQSTGTFDFSITATNGEGTTTQDLLVTVFAAPTITSVPNEKFLLGVTYAYDDDGLPEAIGTAPIVWSLEISPANIAFDASTGRMIWTPVHAEPAPVTLRASNDYGFSEQSFVISRESATPPALGRTANAFASSGEPYRYDADNHVDVTGTVSGENLQVFVEQGPPGFIVHPTSREVGWVASSTGVHELSLSLSTPGGPPLDQYDFTIDVTSDVSIALAALAAATPQIGPAPLTAVLDGSASTGTDGVPLLQYTWTTQTGAILRSSTPSITYTFEQPGTYMVGLEIWDALGFLAHQSVGITALDGDKIPPLARIEADHPEGDGSIAVQFNCNCSDSDGEIVATLWQFGDGSTSDEASPLHHFDQPGSYTVRLSVEDDDGLPGYDSAIVVVRSQHLYPPSAAIETTQIVGNRPMHVELRAVANDRDGVVESVLWTLPDGTVDTNNTVQFTLVEATYHTVKLEVVDNDGLSGFDLRTLVVKDNDVRPPRIVSEPDLIAFTTTPYQYDLDGYPSAQADRPIFWSLGRTVDTGIVNAPTGMVVDLTTGALQWTPSESQVGEHRITLNVNNEAGADFQDFIVMVRNGTNSPIHPPDETTEAAVQGCACSQKSNPADASATWLCLFIAWAWRRRYKG